jgi:hypothetical protein
MFVSPPLEHTCHQSLEFFNPPVSSPHIRITLTSLQPGTCTVRPHLKKAIGVLPPPSNPGAVCLFPPGLEICKVMAVANSRSRLHIDLHIDTV